MFLKTVEVKYCRVNNFKKEKILIYQDYIKRTRKTDFLFNKTIKKDQFVAKQLK